jgi:hypothetical protein
MENNIVFFTTDKETLDAWKFLKSEEANEKPPLTEEELMAEKMFWLEQTLLQPSVEDSINIDLDEDISSWFDI